MKVIEWNVHGLAKNRCPSYVADEIKRQDADIAILLEYVESVNFDGKFEKNLRKAGYELFRQPKDKEGNAVFIAVKNEHFDYIDCRERRYLLSNRDVNFMAVKVKYGSYIITIIGCRIVPSSTAEERLLQLESIFDYIDSLPREDRNTIIVAGDFNNYRIVGEENYIESFEQYNKMVSENYNLQRIKKKFKEAGFYVNNSTPKGNVFNVYSTMFNACPYKYDHIFVKGMNIDPPEYDWSYKEQNYVSDGGRDPDHAILKTCIEL